MGQLALAPEEPLYREFGIDAEILIDHAWGVEPVRMEHIKAYRSKSHSLSSGQVLSRDYNFDDALLVMKEMADTLALELVAQGLAAMGVSLMVGYSMTAEQRAEARADGTPRGWYKAIESDGGSWSLGAPTTSRAAIMEGVVAIFEERVRRDRPIHRLNVSLTGVVERGAPGVQMSLLDLEEESQEEHARQSAIAAVKQKFGKNALLKGIDLLPQATQRERNAQIGGHRSGE